MAKVRSIPTELRPTREEISKIVTSLNANKAVKGVLKPKMIKLMGELGETLIYEITQKI